MPILEVEVVGALPRGGRPSAARRVADAVATVLGTPDGHAWVRLRCLSRRDYAENGGAVPAGVRPVFVRLLLASPPSGRRQAAQAAALAHAIGEALGREDAHVHLLYEPPALGRIAFGGRILVR
ncbi:MAG: hypothetical protein HY722_00255 [Planctomycetes bacterium]|nr:hypothetical protein [Planctomycetota bacterium]